MTEKPKTYKDLIFWQKSFEVAVMILQLAKELPKSIEIKIILSQLLRSVMSIGANVAEGYGRYGKKEFPRFLQVALGSANETDYWLNLLKVSVPGFTGKIDLIIDKNTEVIKMLAKSIGTIRNRYK